MVVAVGGVAGGGFHGAGCCGHGRGARVGGGVGAWVVMGVVGVGWVGGVDGVRVACCTAAGGARGVFVEDLERGVACAGGVDEAFVVAGMGEVLLVQGLVIVMGL